MNSWWDRKGSKRERDSLLPTTVASPLGLGSRRRGEARVALVSLPLGQLPLPPPFMGKCILLMTAEALLGGKAMFTQLLLSCIPKSLLF